MPGDDKWAAYLFVLVSGLAPNVEVRDSSGLQKL